MGYKPSLQHLVHVLFLHVLFLLLRAHGLEADSSQQQQELQDHLEPQNFATPGAAGMQPTQLHGMHAATPIPHASNDAPLPHTAPAPEEPAGASQAQQAPRAAAAGAWKKVGSTDSHRTPVLEAPSVVVETSDTFSSSSSDQAAQQQTEGGERQVGTGSGSVEPQEAAEAQPQEQLQQQQQQELASSQQSTDGSVVQAVGEQPSAAQVPLAAGDALLGELSSEQVRGMLRDAQQQLFNASRRDVGAGLRGMAELSRLVQRLVPEPSRRRLMGGAGPPDAAPAAAGATAAGTVASGSLLPKARGYNGTGMDAAAHAAFTMAALQAHRLLEEHVGGARAGGAEAMVGLHHAAMAGSMEAMYALVDRWAHGHGVRRDEAAAMQYARLAGQWLIEDAEAAARFAPPLAPPDLREAWADRRYISAEQLENSDRALAMEEDMALRGSVDAQRRLAYRRMLGRGLEADPEGALRDFEAAAAQGDAYAIFNLGYMHMQGLGVPVDHARARALFERAAAKNLPAAWSGLGSMFWTGQGGAQNLTAAFEAYLKGAALNNSDSMYNLGVMYLHGVGTEVNQTRGFEYFQMAESIGHWKAAFILATLYDAGTGVERNITKALFFYRKLFKERASWTESVTAAAGAFDDGDHWGALAQFVVAAEQGSDTAAVNAAWMLRRGLGYRGPGALDLAARLFERAARQGSAAGAVELAHMIHDAEQLGLARPRNLSQVFFWYVQAAAANSSEGTFYLAWAHHRGIGTQRNASKAAELYRRGIKLAGNVTTQFQRMVAPSLGLLAIQLDRLLEPWFGLDATLRAALRLQRLLRLGPRPLSAGRQAGAAPGDAQAGPGRGEDGLPPAAGAGQMVSKDTAWQAALQVLRRMAAALSSDQVDNVLMTVCLGSLAAVLGIRHYQRLTRNGRAQRQHTAEPAA